MHRSIDLGDGARRGAAVSARRILRSALPLLPLIAATVVIVAPLLWAISTSLHTAAGSFTEPPQWIPSSIQWGNYRAALDQGLGSWMLNSAIVSVSVVAGQVITSALAGYAFARFRFPGSGLLFWLVLATLMIPLQATIIPVFVLVSKLGLNDSLGALIVPTIVSPFGTFLMRQYFLTMPADLEEAATIDGAGIFGVFWSIYLPLAVPSLAILAILAFNGSWNDYFRPLIFLSDQHHYTVPLGIVTLFGYLGTGSVSVVMAGVVLSMLVVLLVYLVGQRYLVEGLTAGSIKS